jgi:Trypsin-like peptidase domain
MTARWNSLARMLLVVGLPAILALGGSRPVLAQSFLRPAPVRDVFVLITMDRTTWWPYEYGTGFFFDANGDAYTASNVVRDAVENPNLMLIALVGQTEYAAHVECWNPTSPDRTKTFNRDVAIVHVGPEVPYFPLWSYHPATTPLAEVPLPVNFGAALASGQSVRVVGFGPLRGDTITRQEEQGRVGGVLRAADGTEILTVEFPSGPAPQDGASGAPVVDQDGTVVGIAVWQAAHPRLGGPAGVSGVAAASLGCVTQLPSGPTPNALPVPLRQP